MSHIDQHYSKYLAFCKESGADDDEDDDSEPSEEVPAPTIKPSPTAPRQLSQSQNCIQLPLPRKIPNRANTIKNTKKPDEKPVAQPVIKVPQEKPPKVQNDIFDEYTREMQSILNDPRARAAHAQPSRPVNIPPTRKSFWG